MKYTAKLPLVLILALLIIPISIFSGCGDNKSIPDKSTITINPTSWVVKDILGDTPANFTVVVRYSDGTPIPYANINITGAFAVPATAAFYQFYYYPGGSIRPGGNSPVDSGFNDQTNVYGVYEFSAEVFGPGSAFKDTIYVNSGAVSGTATLELTTT